MRREYLLYYSLISDVKVTINFIFFVWIIFGINDTWKFLCNVTQKKFSFRSMLRRNIRIHNGGKSFSRLLEIKSKDYFPFIMEHYSSLGHGKFIVNKYYLQSSSIFKKLNYIYISSYTKNLIFISTIYM